jgi:hypothetical protein
MLAVEKRTLIDRLRELPGPRGKKKIDHNTYAYRDIDGTIRICLHNTDIITVSPNEVITLTSGGWKTATTKDRLNCNLGPCIRITQSKGLWYIHQEGRATQLFEDGMVIGKSRGKSDKKALQLREKVKQFAKKYIAKLQAGEMDAPGPGDCFLCCMDTTDNATSAQLRNWADHIQSHMREGYYVPRMLYNALNTMPASQVMKWVVQSCWDKQPEKFANLAGNGVWKELEKCFRRYLYRQLGLPT